MYFAEERVSGILDGNPEAPVPSVHRIRVMTAGKQVDTLMQTYQGGVHTGISFLRWYGVMYC